MPYYYPKKQDAIDAGHEMFGDDWCIGANMEPYNGWVIVLSPKTLAYLTQPLEPILAHAEIQITHTIRRRPEGYAKPAKVEIDHREERRRRRKERKRGTAPSAPPPPPVVRPAVATAAPSAPPPPPPPPRPA